MTIPATIRAARDHLALYALRRALLREGRTDEAQVLTAQFNLDPLEDR